MRRLAHRQVREREEDACVSGAPEPVPKLSQANGFGPRPVPRTHSKTRHTPEGWSYPAFTDGLFLWLMVSDVSSVVPSQGGGRGRQPSVGPVPQDRFKPHG